MSDNLMDVQVDVTKATADLKRIRDDQLPFAISLGLNRTAVAALDRRRAALDADFTIADAKKPFFRRLIKFPKRQWATKRKLVATVGVHEQDGDFGVGSSKDRGFLLGRHEGGGDRTRLDPMRPFFVPTDELRSGVYDVPPKSMYPAALRLFESRGIVRYQKDAATGKRKGIRGTLAAQAKGKRDTFIVDARSSGNPKAWGIYQRFGTGRRDIRMLWAFRSKIRLKKRLGFYTGVNAYVEQNFGHHFDQAIDEAMRTAR
jgi:hypothetical protein